MAICSSLAAVLFAAAPGPAGSAPSCKPKKEASGCVVRNAAWGKFGFGTSARIGVEGAAIAVTLDLNGRSSNTGRPSAPCGPQMSNRSAVLFSGTPNIRGTIRIGKTYTKTSTWSQRRGQRGFHDPGTGVFGGVVESMAARWSLKVKFISARSVRVTATGVATAVANDLDRSDPSNPKPIRRNYRCAGSLSKTLARTQ